MFIHSLRLLAKAANNCRHNNKCLLALRCFSVESNTATAFPQQDCILRRPEVDVDIPNATLPEFVWANVDKWADKTALVCDTTGRNYTYGALRKRSVNFAKALRGRLSFHPRTTLAVLLPNIPEFPIALLGAIEAGLIVTTVNPVYTADEISRQLIDSNTKVIVTLCEYFGRTKDALNTAKISVPIITIKTRQGECTPDGAIDFAELCENETNCEISHSASIDDIILMPYSSGTTGLPKGVELTHKNLVANLCQNKESSSYIRPTTDANQDIVPAVLPMFHIYGLTMNTLKIMTLGCKIIAVPKFTPETYVDMLLQQKPHHLMVVPPIVIFLAAHPAVSKSHLDPVLSILSGAAPLGASDVERLFEKTGREIQVIQGYGMTETSPVICATPPSMWRECLGSIGRVLPNTECKVVSIEDPNGPPLGPNESGELLVRGPQVMGRYHNNPAATEEVFVDGWLRTGDMVYYNNQQIIWITDRLKELIKVKGFQVAPAELEAIIRDHPQVADAAVIGVPHPISGEVPRAFVVPKMGKNIDCEAIKGYVAQKVASYKRLEGGVTVLDAIPKNPSGKIMRRTLKAAYATDSFQ